jgi:hypothetical protein
MDQSDNMTDFDQVKIYIKNLWKRAPLLRVVVYSFFLFVIFFYTSHIHFNDEIIIMDKPVDVKWYYAPPSKYKKEGFYSLMVRSNAKKQYVDKKGHGFIDIPDENLIHFEQFLASRKVKSIYGETLLEWYFVMNGFINSKTKEYDITESTSGFGYFYINGKLLEQNHIIVLISESARGENYRHCFLEFQLHLDGKITFVGNLTEQDALSKKSVIKPPELVDDLDVVMEVARLRDFPDQKEPANSGAQGCLK